VQRVHDLFNVAESGIDRRRALKLFASVGAAGALSSTLAACTSSSTSSRSGQTLRVGLVVPQSGPLQESGFEMHNGFSLYLNLHNNVLGGMNTSVKVIDEGPTTASGTAAVRTALKSGSYDVLVGVANSQVLAQVAADVTLAHIPLVGSNGSPSTMHASPYIWRASFIAGQASTALAAYLNGLITNPATGGELQKPTLIVVYDDGSPDGRAEADAFIAGISTNASTSYPTIRIKASATAPTAPGIFSQIASSGADLVYAATSGANGEAFVTAYAKAKLGITLCGPGALTEQSTQPKAALNVYTSMNYAPDLDNNANATFASAYFSQAQGKIPTAYAMATYDAATVLDVTIANVHGPVSAETINDNLGFTQTISSPRGRWQFNQGRTPVQQWYLRQVRADGEVLDNRVLAQLETLG
jgi:branched-chain amino acid transport system substrate-binding protein